MIKTMYKGWQVLSNGDASLYAYLDAIINKDIRGHLLKEIKNNSRSQVLLIDFIGKPAILKSPREKNTGKWIRFTTLYRRGEAFKFIQNLDKFRSLGIPSNKPIMAMEKRRLGMVVDSWILYEYLEGRVCGKNQYSLVVKKLHEIHSHGILHGDPQIDNFLTDGENIFVIDCAAKRPLLGNISKFFEFFFLEHSAPGIEKYFDLPVKKFSYRAAQFFSRLYWRWRHHKKQQRNSKRKKLNILIIRLSSIGDIILTTPVIEAIKKKYPNALINFLVMNSFQDAISGNPDIDTLILFDKNRYIGLVGLWKFCRQLRPNKWDLIIDLHAKVRSIIISSLLKGRVWRYKKRAVWKSLFVPLGLVRYTVDDTIVRNYFKPLEKLHIYFTKEKLSFHFNETHMARVKQYDNFIVFAPGAAAKTKQWPAKNFTELGRMLQEKIVLIGGVEDFDAFEGIRAGIGNSCENLAGKLSLKESGALISRSRYVLTNDSGPFHIARGVSRKVFVIFGPTDPAMFDYDENAVLIYAKAPCAPCSLHGDKACPKGHFECMRSLTPEKVYNIIRRSP